MLHLHLLPLRLLLAALLVGLAPWAAWAQNVGIGTTAPTQTLDVNGTLRVRAAAGSGDGRLLGVAADGTLQPQSAPFGATAPATPQTPASLGTVATGSAPDGVAVNPAGTRAYVTNYGDNTLQTFDLTGSTPMSLGTVASSRPYGVAVNPAGTRAYVTNYTDKTLQTFDLTGSTPMSLGTVGTGNGPNGVAVNPAGTRAYVANYTDKTLQTFDLTGSTPMSLGTVGTGSASSAPSGVAVNPAGTRAYVTNFIAGTLQTFDLTGSTPMSLGTVGTGSYPRGVAVNPAGTRAYVTNYGDNTLQTFDLTGSTPMSLGTVGTGSASSAPSGVAVNPAGTRAYVVNANDNTLQTFVIGSPRLVAVGADGTLGSVDPTTLGDNLGNHTATQNLNLGSYQLVGNGGSQGLAISATGKVGLGTTAPATQLDVNGNLRLAVRLCPVNQTTTYALTTADLAYSIFKVQNSAFAPSLTLPPSSAGQVEGQELTLVTTADFATTINGTNTDNTASVALAGTGSAGLHAVQYVWVLPQTGRGYWVRVQ